MMKFKINLLDGTVIYANDICIYRFICRKIGIWAKWEEIDRIDMDRVHEIWLLDPAGNILIYV